jgi:hypothetical protein
MTREQIIRELATEGLVIVPAEPTVEMVEAGFRKGMRLVPKYVRETIENWRVHAGTKHPGEPGLVAAIREAVRAGALKP